MNDNNGHGLLSFVLGAALGGAAAYYLFKHQDDIIDKINEIEGTLNLDHNALIDQAKTKFDAMAESVQATIQRYTHSDAKPSSEDITSMMEELGRLREEVKALSAKS